MNNENHTPEPTDAPSTVTPEPSSHPIATGLGATGGGLAGAALGHSAGGKVGAAVGGVAGAIVGGLAGNALAEFAEAVIEETSPSLGFGADTKPIELPSHYSWQELQALSKPQVNHQT
jgi:outer membrane lipoprotein SlyB